MYICSPQSHFLTCFVMSPSLGETIFSLNICSYFLALSCLLVRIDTKIIEIEIFTHSCLHYAIRDMYMT